MISLDKRLTILLSEFTNETKETENWQVGIRCYGEAANLSQGYFEQPQMLIEVE